MTRAGARVSNCYAQAVFPTSMFRSILLGNEANAYDLALTSLERDDIRDVVGECRKSIALLFRSTYKDFLPNVRK